MILLYLRVKIGTALFTIIVKMCSTHFEHYTKSKSKSKFLHHNMDESAENVCDSKGFDTDRVIVGGMNEDEQIVLCLS